MGKLKISSELLEPMDFWNLAWSAGPNLGQMGKLKISSEVLKPTDYWNLAWATGLNLGLMRKMRFSRRPEKIQNLSETTVKRNEVRKKLPSTMKRSPSSSIVMMMQAVTIAAV